jgi:hypothetical protein
VVIAPVGAPVMPQPLDGAPLPPLPPLPPGPLPDAPPVPIVPPLPVEPDPPPAAPAVPPGSAPVPVQEAASNDMPAMDMTRS